jgi:hypothetical protein
LVFVGLLVQRYGPLLKETKNLQGLQQFEERDS